MFRSIMPIFVGSLLTNLWHPLHYLRFRKKSQEDLTNLHSWQIKDPIKVANNKLEANRKDKIWAAVFHFRLIRKEEGRSKEGKGRVACPFPTQCTHKGRPFVLSLNFAIEICPSYSM